jgi:tRNA-Thr(GGU) m(6)t(6)A37 methyltransferase TsaA
MLPGGFKMTSQLPNMVVKPIGIVRNKIKKTLKPEFDWRGIISQIVVDTSLSEALDGLEGYSHIIVLYWLHRATDTGKMVLKVHPKGNKELPLVGLFASRSPYRPNPVGRKIVRLLKHQGSILWVEGLDAIDKTPVIDIKPYIPGYDSAVDATVPQWNQNK